MVVGSITAINPILKSSFVHILNSSLVFLNCQPTLHKPSMMAHFVRVLKGEKTLRMHYANCRFFAVLSLYLFFSFFWCYIVGNSLEFVVYLVLTMLILMEMK